MPKVSIGFPVYNGQEYIHSSIDSILNQTYEDFELVISDNASTDETQAICLEYAAKDPRVRYHRQASNVGLARNFNEVFLRSTAPYFKWVSHDDLHAPEFVSRCVEVLDRDPSVLVVTPRGLLIDALGREIRMIQKDGHYYWPQDSGELIPIRPYDPPRDLASDKPHIRFREILLKTAWCLEIYGLMRSDALRKTPLHLPFVGQDKRILAELALMGRMAEIPEVLFYYRQHAKQGQRYCAPAREQQAYVSGDAVQWTKVPRLDNLLQYRTALRRVHLDTAERLRCSAVLVEWFCQINKWPGLFREAMHNMGDMFAHRHNHGPNTGAA